MLFQNFNRKGNMTRIKEPEIGNPDLPNYKSPPSRIVRSLRKAYDNLRAKLDKKAQAMQSLQGKLRDTQESRDTWKKNACAAKAEIASLQQENEKLKEELKKKGNNYR